MLRGVICGIKVQCTKYTTVVLRNTSLRALCFFPRQLELRKKLKPQRYSTKLHVRPRVQEVVLGDLCYSSKSYENTSYTVSLEFASCWSLFRAFSRVNDVILPLRLERCLLVFAAARWQRRWSAMGHRAYALLSRTCLVVQCKWRVYICQSWF